MRQLRGSPLFGDQILRQQSILTILQDNHTTHTEYARRCDLQMASEDEIRSHFLALDTDGDGWINQTSDLSAVSDGFVFLKNSLQLPSLGL